MTTQGGNATLLRSFQQLVCVSDPFWLFEGALQRPSTSPCEMLLELQRNIDIVMYAPIVLEAPGHHQEQLLQILNVFLVKSKLLLLLQKIWLLPLP